MEVNWTRKDLLSLYDLTPEEIVLILDTAEEFKKVSERNLKKVPALRGKTVVNFFVEPSTRTRVSFELAEQRLSADIINMTATSLTEQLTAADQSACQAACSANTKCQYFVWYAYKGAINAASQAQCYLRLAAQAITAVPLTQTSTNPVAFEVRLRNADSRPGRFMSTRCRHAPRARDAQLHSAQL